MNDSTFIISGSGSKLAYRASCRRESCIYSEAESGFVVHLMSKKELHHAAVSADGVILFTKTQHAQDRTEVASAGEKRTRNRGVVSGCSLITSQRTSLHKSFLGAL